MSLDRFLIFFASLNLSFLICKVGVRGLLQASQKIGEQVDCKLNNSVVLVPSGKASVKLFHSINIYWIHTVHLEGFLTFSYPLWVPLQFILSSVVRVMVFSHESHHVTPLLKLCPGSSLLTRQRPNVLLSVAFPSPDLSQAPLPFSWVLANNDLFYTFYFLLWTLAHADPSAHNSFFI